MKYIAHFHPLSMLANLPMAKYANKIAFAETFFWPQVIGEGMKMQMMKNWMHKMKDNGCISSQPVKPYIGM